MTGRWSAAFAIAVRYAEWDHFENDRIIRDVLSGGLPALERSLAELVNTVDV